MPHHGLSSSDAQKLFILNGPNTITDTSPINPVKILISQFKSILIIILLTAGIIAYFLGDSLDTIFIFGIVILNALFGFSQEFRAERAIKALKKLVPNQIRVIRDGKEKLIDTRYLVVGDVVKVEEGSKVPADCQLLEVHGLEVDEASLTGESTPIPKVIDGDEAEAQIFLGTTITKGNAFAQVIATGSDTRFGKIAKLIKSIPDEATPLQKQLNTLSKTLGYSAIIATILIFFMGVFRGLDIFQMLLTSVSLAVAVVPEGLPAVITITLALGVQRMSRQKAIVRKLNSIETLGSTNVICTDKTGTLTQNDMSAKFVFLDFKIQDVTAKLPTKLLTKLIEIATIANNATAISTINEEKLEIGGDKTEGALLNLAHRLKFSTENFRTSGKLIEEFPFDSDLKTMSVIWESRVGTEILTKGAPEVILEKCSFILEKSGRTRKLTSDDRQKILTGNDTLASKGERVLGFSYKKITENKISRQNAEKGMVFVGLVSISDPLRPEIKQAITLALSAGIRTVMITGDNPLTAHTIAHQAGIISTREKVILGDEVAEADEVKLENLVKNNNVFARIGPVDKNRIVRALQKLGFVVAVTGDGVNDAPALKQADVGVAMAITGTDVAKETADIVLTDDNYATLITAVEEGRVIYDNILKSLKFLLASNSSELFLIVTAVFIGIPIPLTPLQILWINLVTDSLPALALAADPKDPEIMQRLPRSRSRGLLHLINPLFLIKLGIGMASLTILVFLMANHYLGLESARTISFTTLIFLQLISSFLIRGDQKWNSNKNLILATVFICFLQMIVLLNPEFRKVFNLG